MVLKGLGVDVVRVQRFKRVMERTPKLRFRLFTHRELVQSYAVHSLAGRFASKEALLKATGTGLRFGIRWKDIEILGDPKSPPRVVLSGKAKEMFSDLEFFLSVSHEEDIVIAVCLAIYAGT